MRLALTGDVMLGRLMNDAVGRWGPAYPWGDTLPLLRACDLRLINLECVIAESGEPWTRTSKVFHFRAAPAAMECLRQAQIDCVSLANNHVLDYGEAAFAEMLGRLKEAGIAYAGAGRNLAEASHPALLEAAEIRIAVLAFTDNQPEWAAAPARPGVRFVPVSDDGAASLADAVAAARSRADVLICSAHWGPNMRLRPPEEFKRFARRLIDLGVDLFHGHSAHVFQGIEVYRGKPILYDTADYVDDYAVDPELRNDRSFLFQVTFSRSGVTQIDLLPVLISQCQVNRATGRDFEETCATMRKLAAELGTELEMHVEGLRLTIKGNR
jgi:poly-gamma-glutamate synthesis protein (capsule biosynthesis protein)